jgi:hypothetical protein
MPRNLTRPGHALDQIVDLCEAKLLQIHMSDVALREWRSQMTKDFLDTIKEMHSHLRHTIRQPLSKKLANRKLISQLLDRQDATTAEATREANKSCDEFIKKLGINEMPIDASDGATVFKAYFAGEAPFREPKSRDDLPDAFILCAARRFAMEQFSRTRLAICSDKRLRGAIAKIPDIEPFETMMDFLQSAPIKEAMGHLDLSRLWTAEKGKEAIAFLSKQRKYLSKLIHDFAYETLQGQSFTDSSIPVDNNEAIISAFGELEDLEVEWDKVEQYGPGWLVVPFRFESDTELELAVYRADTFGVPDWIHVTIGDYEKDHYFEATAERRLAVMGYLSFRFTKDEITATKLRVPASVEVEDYELELVDKDEYEDAY